MSPNQQTASKPVLWVALLVTLALVYWQWAQEDDSVTPEDMVATPAIASSAPTVAPTPRDQAPVEKAQTEQIAVVVETPSEAVVQAAPLAEPHLYFTRQLPADKVSHTLFAAQEWLPPPPKPQPPPPPQAPPLPYTYVGSMQDVPDGDTVILMQQNKVFLYKLGSQINPQWRLDRENAQAVYFTYLPLNKSVALSKTKTATASHRQASANTQNNYSEEMLNQ